MKTVHRRYQALEWPLLALAAVFFVCPGILPAQTAPPTVATDFFIESQLHQDNFKPDSKRREFELEIAAKLAALCQERFGFLKWLPVNQAGESPIAQLRLVMKADPRPHFPPILLEYETFHAGQKASSGLPAEVLYSGFDEQNAHKHDALKQDLLAKIQKQFDTDAFREALHKGFLQHIPLAAEVQLEEPEVIIPLRSDELRASDQSILVVLFRTQPEASLRDGVIRLTPIGQHNGSVSCLIVQLRFPNVMVVDLGGWHPRIPEILQPPAIRELKVFMEKYEPKLVVGTAGPLATRPD